MEGTDPLLPKNTQTKHYRNDNKQEMKTPTIQRCSDLVKISIHVYRFTALCTKNPFWTINLG